MGCTGLRTVIRRLSQPYLNRLATMRARKKTGWRGGGDASILDSSSSQQRQRAWRKERKQKTHVKYVHVLVRLQYSYLLRKPNVGIRWVTND
jgi:hypothetical protein